MEKIAGLFKMSVNGRYETIGEGTFTVSPDGFTRDAKLSSSGVAGFIEKAQAPYIECEFLTVKDFSLKRIQSWENETIAAEGLGGGKTVILYNAFYAGGGSLSANEGTFKAKLIGTSAEIID
jgi:NAD dependent epimerase/dehydratase family enzyme